MRRFFAFSGILSTYLILAIFPGWSADNNDASSAPDLSRLVVVGDSLSAGFQNFSLYDYERQTEKFAPPGGQRYGFAAFVARQAKTNLGLPFISYPGIPPALVRQKDGDVTRAPGVGAREAPAQTRNLSVPGFNVIDALYHVVNVPKVLENPEAATFEDVLTLEVLGYPGLLKNPPSGCGVLPLPKKGYVLFSEAGCAVELKPTTILVSIGDGDALQTLTLGIAPTDLKQFADAYFILIDALSRTGAKVVVSNVPDVTDVPFLVSYTQFEKRCGVPPSGAGSDDYAVPKLTGPSFDICTEYEIRSTALIKQARTAVHDYNVIIAATAAKFGAVVVDVNRLFSGIAQNGIVIGKHHLTSCYLGGIFSLDAIHPTNTGYAILANAFIDEINSKLGAKIPRVDVEQVANSDPLVFQ